MTEGKMTVVIGVSQLQSTSSDILSICPRFRLLVIGKSGVGKSSLIQHAFKIDEVHVSEHRRGEADIEREFIAPENERFVLHDSQGFEAGDGEIFTTAKKFISCRREMPELRDKIHAVWLCLSIPHANGRLLESGVEEFLKLRKEILGNIPIIAVFTKHDVFVDELELAAAESAEYEPAVLDKFKVDTLDKLCIQPLQDAAGSDIPHATVSTNEEYESTIRQLVDLTTTNVEKFVASEAALAMMIAQRVDIGLKVKASIAIGEKRYWRGLASSMNFTGFTMLDCLSVIHKDIIDVWNFNDPLCHLVSDRFKELMLKDIDKVDLPHTAQAFEFGLSVVATIASILTSLASGPLLPIVVPLATGVVVVKWAYDTYQRTNVVLRRIMTYIVDLTCIMQILFLLVPTGPVSRHIIKIAIEGYGKACKDNIHLAIQSHCMSVTRRGDDVLDKIVELIEGHSIKPEEVHDLRMQIGPVDSKADEEW
ncbi:uncharacterized protein EDB93DRAFT_647877 [Suillus bovinus]|uniref:uncharacterized protein n=1 Tax=Suillus bovinus TaxID=48563 RepID=UPI001B8755C7|nr:uncharacterized protein EDB93DRAFT_647877 [Suillus bovinus]KAG2140935.1 hypothetical protein EDB93DRAFT_647877 [Suillus bovinus]